MWVTAGLALLATVGLALVAVLADLDTAGQAASVVGSMVGLAALLVSVVTLFRGGGSRSGRRVRAGRGAVAAGGNITGSALGKDSKVTGPRTPPGSVPTQRDGDDVRAGRDGVATGGDITDSALGEGSER
ncbi:hypothetical protein OG978_01300 [Streptomyces sp. NBC_01591]|uniref:hypothetical protein n=1 Tax=Streptomyces sp. NBC_01591 TaxID=2975888 RepID=UPI002DDC1ABF|nr:hypothetical protein [Streptomyces sp. NBC_01591]WSD66192.1 hypothetical protein OG978_01300 [Streptomyces sp. NBC_01591]